MSTLDRYERELALLRESAREVGAAFPEIGHLLGEREGDLAVERVIQGTALLAARVSGRLEDELPELLHPLFERLWPQYLRPIPPVTLLRFSPAGSGLTQAYTVPAGTIVRSKKVDGASLEFSTIGEVEVLPAELAWVGLERPRPESFELSLELIGSESVSLGSAGMKRLRLSFVGPEESKALLYEWALRQCRGISLKRARTEPPFFRLGPEALSPVGFGPNESLRGGGTTPLAGFGLLEEFFVFKDRLWGVELSLVGAPLETLDDRLVISLDLGALPPITHEPILEDFALGVAPAVGVSTVERIDFDVEDARTEFRIEPASGGSVYTVDRVGAYDVKSGGWTDFIPLAHKREAGQTVRRPRYEVRRRPSGVGGSDVLVAIADSDARPQAPETERLSVWVTTTRPDLAGKLGVGDVSLPAPGMPSFLRVSNIVPVNGGAASPLERGRLWQLISLFSMPTDELLSLAGIRRLVAEAVPRISDVSARLIVDVKTTRTARLEQRMMVPLSRVALRVDQAELGTAGETFLLGQVLHRALSRPSEIGAIELSVRSEDPAIDFRFE